MLRFRFHISAAALCLAITAAPSSGQTSESRLTPAQALESDAGSYARAYGVPLDEAKRRMLIMGSSGAEVAALETEIGSILSGSYFSHDGAFELVIRVTGATLPANRTLTVSTGRTDIGVTNLDVPVRFEASSGVSRARAREIIGSSNALLRSTFPTLQGFGYDERTGEMSVLVGGTDLEAGAIRTAGAGLAVRLGMPVRIEVAPVAVAPQAVRGGAPLYLSDGRRWCTTAFVARNSAGRTGALTAGHCDEPQEWREGTATYPLTMAIHFDAWGDYGFLTGNVEMVPEFYGNRNEAPRILKGRRFREGASTVERTATTAGSYICAYGQATGPRYGQSCGEVTSKYYDPNYPAPGCSNSPTYVDCHANFVEIRARGTETMYCNSDSGAPIFTYDVAWGILSGCATYPGTDRTYNIIYTPVDEIDYGGYTLVFG